MKLWQPICGKKIQVEIREHSQKNLGQTGKFSSMDVN